MGKGAVDVRDGSPTTGMEIDYIDQIQSFHNGYSQSHSGCTLQSLGTVLKTALLCAECH